MAKQKYQELAENVVSLLGGKENISSLSHCMTRLRFNIKDKSKVDASKVEELEDVVGTQWQNDQFQIIVGQGVGEAFRLINSVNGLSGTIDTESNSSQDEPEKNKKKFGVSAVIDVITSSITEVLPILIGAGMLNVVLILLTTFNLVQEGGPTATTLSFVADAGLYFLPIYVGAASAKKFNMNMYLGMFFGAVLIHPTFTGLLAEGTPGAIFGVPITAGTYTSSIFPVIITNFVASYVYKWIEKRSPEVIKTMLVPLLTILIVAPLMLVGLAPLGGMIGDVLATALVWVYEKVGFIGLGILGAVHPFLVITGMHHSFGPYIFQSLASLGYEAMFFPVTYINNINQGVAALAVGLKSKNVKIKGTSTSAGIPAIIAGVSEPALFGINLKYRTPLYAVMIGNFIGCCVAGFFGTVGYAFVGSFGILGLPAFMGEKPNNLLFIVIALIVSSIITFIATMILYKEKPAEN